jgi:hypothetical protein
MATPLENKMATISDAEKTLIFSRIARVFHAADWLWRPEKKRKGCNGRQ